MPEPGLIDRSNKLSRAEDYNFLRREGIRLIQNLSGKVWTDYNTHDPGITLLEALCYTLTDLGYRTSFNIKDILAPPARSADTWQKIFYTARQALPCNPVTLNDYRKIIIDTEGVRNAWIEVSEDYEMIMYLRAAEDPEEPSRQGYHLAYDAKKGDDALRLRGLYKVYVDYELDIIDGKKEEEVAQKIKDKLNARRNLCEDFISVSAIEYEFFRIEAEVQVHEGSDIEQVNARMYEVIYNFLSPPIRFYSLEQMLAKGRSAEEIFEGPLLRSGFIDTEELEKSERYKDIHLSDIISLISGIEGIIAVKRFSLPTESQAAFTNFPEWITKVKDRQKVPRLDMEKSVITFIRSGDRHRDPADQQPNPERVKAVFTFLQSAKINWRFRGAANDLPVPTGEFMDIAEYHPFQKSLPAVYGMAQTYIDHQLNESSIRNAVNELLEEKVGLAIREFMYGLLAEIPGNTALRKVMGDLLHLPADEARVQELINSVLEDKSNEAHISHLVGKLLTGTTYPVPEKEQVRLLLEKHQPNQFGVSRKTRILQEIVPQTLGLTLFDLLDQEDQALKKKQLRKVREAYKKYQLAHLAVKEKLTLQLRGFLMVFEQILADYLAQLASIRQLFSFDPQVQQTYVAQSLEGVDDLESLFLDYDQYRESQKELTETEETFIKRRNAFLDHLLGRFGEDMSKYAFYLNAALGKKAGSKLIADKIDFLADYIEVSKNRGKGFDYSNGQETWDSDNVEGLKKRICRLLGIKEYRERDNDFNRNAGGDDPEEHYQARDYNKKFIAPAAIHVDKVKRDDNIEWYGVTLTDPEDPDYVLLKSELYEFEDEAQEILNYILAHGVAENLYEKEGRRDNWSYHLKRAAQENNEEPVASGYFQSQQESEDAFRRTIEVLTEYAQDENFHLLEHLLLRPRIPARSPTNRQGVLNADAVDFLSVAYVSDKALAGQRQENAGEEAQVTFRFYIKSEKDPHQKSKTIWHLSLVDAESKEVLLVDEVFSLYRHLTRRIEQIRQFGSDRSNYEIGLVSDDYKNFSIQDAARPLAVSKNTFRLEEDLEAGIASLITFFSYERDVFQDEGENYDDVSFLADPYSFQISILIPDWPAKFRNLTFKHLLEKTIYLETPAHIYAHVYWLDHKQMRDFEEAYKLWLEEMATGQIPNAQLVNNLIAQLNALRQ